MNETLHFRKRMLQRGISRDMIELAFDYGRREKDRFILDRNCVDCMLGELDALRKDLIRIRDKGGIVAVAEDETMITTYTITARTGKKRNRYRLSA